MELITTDEFLQIGETMPLLDVRSPSEFNQGHIPGAINLPLLNDEERALVGTCYKQKGNLAAVILGYKLVGERFAGYLELAIEMFPSKKIVIHCWRGGLRSRIMSQIFENGGFTVFVLKGGYKNYRNWVMKTLETEKKIFVLGGLTGSGKTDLLKLLGEKQEQVIDLEALASHKGSALGDLGQPQQPTQENFENLLASQWIKIDAKKTLWLEDESRMIGRLVLPSGVYNQIRNSRLFEIEIPNEMRIQRLRIEYGEFEKEKLIEKTKKIRKRLGDLRTRQAIELIEEGKMSEWVELLLQYYDKTYRYGQSLRPQLLKKLIKIPSPQAVELFLRDVYS